MKSIIQEMSKIWASKSKVLHTACPRCLNPDQEGPSQEDEDQFILSKPYATAEIASKDAG